MVRVSRDVLTVCGDPEAVRRAVGVDPAVAAAGR
jgi:hypothetical protein